MAGRQRIDRVRRQYNQWVANQTLEDYALRFTAKSARRWSAARVANTALGAISFLALEAIGGTITLNYGVTNATAAILVVSVIIFLLRPADRLPCRQMRHRHRPADPRRRFRLHRLDHHFADLRLLHLHLLRDRGGHSRHRAGDVLRHSAPPGLSDQRRRHHSAGHARHHPDQPLPAMDAAGLDRAAYSALRGDRLGQSALVFRVDQICRRARQPQWPSRSAAVRHRRLGGVLAGGADRRAGRLPALSAARPADLANLVVDRAAERRPRLDHSGRAETAGRVVPRLLRAQPWPHVRACRRTRPHVSRSLSLRAVAAGSRAGSDRHLRDPVAAQDQRHQRLCRLDRMVEFLLPPHPQPSRPRGLAGFQRAGGFAADGDRRLQGAGADAGALLQRRHRLGRRAGRPISSSTSRSACARSRWSSSARISTTSIRSGSAR